MRYLQEWIDVLFKGIETSCDDTAVGVVNSKREILAESKYNQWNSHRQKGFPKSNSKFSTSWGGKNWIL